MDLKETLNLPKTNFPLRASLVEREPGRIAHWDSIDLYGRIQEARSGAPSYILHDGPPFTNGDVHIGTALNKILKDILIRYKTMRGFRTPYVPGWDCHGLPIEHKVAKQLNLENRTVSPVELRRACADFSRKFRDIQKKQFDRLGLLADWRGEYRTMDPAYEADVLRFIATCADRNLLYRSKKPVYWSIPCRTALAEAEIEYKDISSPSIWVKFQLEPESAQRLSLSKPAHLVIWTTTPWSLPANRAIAIHPEFTYVALKCAGEVLIVETSLAEKFIANCQLVDVSQIAQFRGQELLATVTRHPFIDRRSPVLAADFVSNDAGTGCVHCAPGHGMEDYILGLRNGLPIDCPIDDGGRYIQDGEMPPSLVGLPILDDSGKSPASSGVLELLRQSGALLAEKKILHSYPHCWRSKTPVVYRAMDQWFLQLDGNGLRKRAIKTAKEVHWIPAWGEKRIVATLENRPDWCISRQRAWGIPLPVFFDEEGRALVDGNVIRAIAEKVEKLGSDCWFIQSAEKLLEDISLPEDWKGKALKKSDDTLDVWMDSGCSGAAVLRKNGDLNFPADLYLEGSDQHRGWFQSSLWCSLIGLDEAPYKAVLTHGFFVGEGRKKISKSDSKPQSSTDYVNRYGADVIRLWISSEDFRNDIPVSDAILDQVATAYASIRNTFRFQLGNLHDFDCEGDAMAAEEMLPLDRWALEKTRQLIGEVTAAYDAFEFHRIYRAILNFCSGTLSATYHDMLKDRLYTYGKNWRERRSAQTAICRILKALLAMATPILSFTADEAYAHLQNDSDFAPQTAHLLPWPKQEEFSGHGAVAEEMEHLLEIRGAVNGKLEGARRGKTIGKSLDARVILRCGNDYGHAELLKKHEKQLPEIFIVSQVQLDRVDGSELKVAVEKAVGERCARSWRWCEDLCEVPGWGKVSPRCKQVLTELFPDHF